MEQLLTFEDGLMLAVFASLLLFCLWNLWRVSLRLTATEQQISEHRRELDLIHETVKSAIPDIHRIADSQDRLLNAHERLQGALDVLTRRQTH